MTSFTLLHDQTIPELNTHARLYRHNRTGAELLSLENDDENKVFGITFRTPWNDSTGIAHIMEHSVLCGSCKYPVKEPFVELVKGSLNTFVNAFTYPDKTCYPVASQNLQDFYNLIDVYMDSVLYPLIPAHTLQQEGWHYELDDPEAPLTYKGVVFNEMKGNYSDPDNVLDRYSRRALFPEHVYGVDSGGDPREIPNLTYTQFKTFHQTYYHPSNARIYFYGDDDPAERLRLMETYLQEFEALHIDSAPPLAQRFTAPRAETIAYDPGEDAMKGMQTLNWLLPETGDAEAVLALQILVHILVGTPAAPLRKALIDSGLGEDLAGAGLDVQLRQAFFSTGLKGMAVDEQGELKEGASLEALILGTLKTLAEEGIDPESTAASLNTVEFRLRENNTGSFPRGLLLMLRALSTWLYDGDPLASLAFEAPLAAVKAGLTGDRRYFEKLIQRYFLENPHRVTVTLKPEPGLAQRQEAEEAQRLAQARAAMSQDDLLHIIEEARRLKEIQETPDTPEALAALPMLRLEDLERQNKLIPLEKLELAGCPVLYHDLFTNGIVYLDLGFDLHALPQEYLPYVDLFGQALLEMGTHTQDFVRLSQRIGRATGGIHPTVFTSMSLERDGAAAWLFLRGKATPAQAGELLAILHDVLLTVRLDNPERFRQMVLEARAGQEAGLVPGGHRVVNSRLRALFNEADWASEQIGGVENLFFLRRLAEEVDQDWPVVLARLEAMRELLVRRGNMLCNVTLDAANWGQFQPRLFEFLERLPAASVRRAVWAPQPGAPFEALTIPAQVNYVGKGANLYDLGWQSSGSIAVINNYLRTTWLWERVRVQGGAYGGFALFNQRSGVYTFLSYRDPNLLGTLENYDLSADFLQQIDGARLTSEELTKSIIGAIGELDAYQLPDAKGLTSLTRYLTGDSDERRQLWRQQILDARLEDFHAFGELLAKMKDAGRVVVLGSADAVQKANAERGAWLEVKKII